MLSSNEERSIFQKIDKFPKLSDLADIIVGLQTSADPVYILEIKRELLYSKFTKKCYNFSKYDIVKPLLKGAEIKRYSKPKVNYKIIFPYKVNNNQVELISKEELELSYSEIWEYFLECENKLKNRENGKMDTSQWWQFGRNQNLNCFKKSKLITQVLASYSSLTTDLEGEYYFVGGGTAGGYGIILKDNSGISYKYLLGLVNSKLLCQYLQSYSTPFKGGFFAYNKNTMGRFPICLASDSQQKIVSKLVDKILDKKSKDSNEETKDFEKEIDKIVYELYGLTPEEIAIIEGGVAK